MHMHDDKQLLHPITMSHRGYTIPLYVISVLKPIVVMKMNYRIKEKIIIESIHSPRSRHSRIKSTASHISSRKSTDIPHDARSWIQYLVRNSECHRSIRRWQFPRNKSESPKSMPHTNRTIVANTCRPVSKKRFVSLDQKNWNNRISLV